MAVLKSIANLRVSAPFTMLKRLVQGCNAASPAPTLLDQLGSREPKRLHRQFQQQWADCPQPIIIKKPTVTYSIPFIRRTSKPSTASKCIKFKECDHAEKRKRCKYHLPMKCERLLPPCPPFSEMIKCNPFSEYTECSCWGERPPLHFKYQPPCVDPRVSDNH